MIKNITCLFAKRSSFLLLIVFMLLSKIAMSQVDIAIGTGTATNSNQGFPCPLQDYYEGSRAQYLFRAAELKTAGMDSGKIYSISFNVTNLNAFSGQIDSLVVKMGTTTATALAAASWAAGANLKVYGAVNYVPTLGKNTLTFTTPFDWNGTSNILLEICNGDPNNSTGIFYSENVSITQSTTAFNSSHTYVTDNLGSLCGSATTTNTGTQTLRPNFTFSWLPKLLCNGTPTFTAATATPSNVCFGQNVTLNVTGVPVASGIVYEWQDSTATSTGFSTIATTKTFVTTQIENTWYRVKIKCTNTNDSVYSNIVLVTTPGLLGGTYTIDKTNPVTYPTNSNFASFNAAYNAMKCGIKAPVVFNVVTGSGPYTEQLIINGKIPNSSTINTITFNGNGETIKFNTTSTTERAVIKLKGAKYFTFDSLKVDASAGATYGIGFHLINDADSNTIKRCSIIASNNITAGNAAGIAISGADNNAAGLGTTLSDMNTITGNTISGGYYGITQTADFAGGANGGNVICNNTIKDFYRYGIYVNGSYNTSIERNRISRPTRTNVGAFDGIYFTGQSNNAHIFRNRIFSPFAAAPTSTSAFIGINLDNASASATNDYKVDNNLIYDVVSAGNVVGINNNATANFQIFYNTISLDDELAITTGTVTTRGYSESGATAVSGVIADNIITITRGGIGTKHCIYLASGVALLNFSLLDYNDYYINSAAGANYIGYYTTNRLSLADWQLATSLETASISIQPVYFLPVTPSLDTANYSPTNAAMSKKGIDLGLTYSGCDTLTGALSYDLLHTVTPERVDMGCYEFVPPPCVPGSLNGVTEIRILGKLIKGDTTVCENTFVNFNVKVVGPYGTSQTFQWQRVIDTANAPANYGSALLTPDTAFQTNDTSYYYRCKISCLGVDYFTNWRKLNSISAMPAGNYYINSSFSALCNYIPGVAGATFATYDTAVKVMRYCGIKGLGDVVFNVVPLSGPYKEQVKIDSVNGATFTRQVVFKGNNTTLAFPTGQPTSTTERALIKLTRADFINFDSLNIDASTNATNGYAIQLLNNADSNSVKNCNITLNSTSTAQTYAGIVINGSDAGSPTTTTGTVLCDGNIFDNNIITGGYSSVSIAGGTATSNPSANNIFSNNKFVDFYNTGAYVAGTAGTIFDHNTFSRPARTNVGVGYGVYLTGVLSLNTKISNNRFTNFYGGQPSGNAGTYGVYFNNIDATPGNENIVFNNAFYNLTGLGFAYPLYNSGSDNSFYFYNSIALDLPANAATGAAAGFYQTVQASGIQFINNIVHITRGGAAAKYCINLNTASTAAGFASDNNDLYVDATVNNGHIGFLNTAYNTLPDWQNAFAPNNQDLASFNYDPLYTDEINGDLKPQFYLINDKGNPTLGVTAEDILGLSRGVLTPDMGAWEFNPPSCPTPLLAGTASVTPSSGICLEVPIQLNLSGNSPVGQVNFQWQDSIAGGSWQNLGPVKYSPVYDTISSVRNYYRCIVTCAATGASVVSSKAKETLNDLLAAGTYTIDSSKVTTPNSPHKPGDNFQSFGEAVFAMQCGILGPVVFDVQKGTFNEQVRLPYVAGTSATNTITFQGSGGVAADKILTWPSATATTNYVLRFDSCTYITFKNITISNTNATNGRVVDFVNKASNDNLIGCIINTPTTLNINTTQSAVYSSPTKGTNLTIQGNTITGGANGIYFTGTSGSATNVVATYGHLIDSNTISANYGAGIFVQYTLGMKVSRNKIAFNTTAANNTAGIFANYCDSGFNLINNRIDINNVNGITAGIQVQNTAHTTIKALSQINGNEVYANTGNTGRITGILVTSSNYVHVKNNVISINSSGNGVCGLRDSANTNNITTYHNSVSVSVASATGMAASFFQATGGNYKIINNIFSNAGGGRAMYENNFNNFSSNYNMLYTTGATLVNAGAGTGTPVNYANINTWRKATGRDKWSVVYQPAFVSNQDLHPDPTNPDSWAIQGRAIQTKGDVTDIHGNYRPDSLTAGVPDLGAYEFFPSVQPPVLPAIPATPAANTLQTFYFGSDTVMRIKWDATPPPSASIRRFSGVVDAKINPRPGTPQQTDSMFFYTSVETPGPTNYGGDVQLYYIEPWLGSLPKDYSEYQIGLGRTLPSGKWIVGCGSRNEMSKKRIYETGLTYMDKFTGLFNPCSPPQPLCSDTSNTGHEFWVAYPANELRNGETFQLYLSAGPNGANVTVSSPGATPPWQLTYNIPPNTVQVSANIPQTNRHDLSGLYTDGIHIESDEPIVAYAHYWGSASSGATMLMPVCTWGYDYKMLSMHQLWGSDAQASYFVIAKEDNTHIAINNVLAPAGVPQITDVVLNTGEWYQVIAAGSSDDLTGSVATSISNSQGKCIPFAFFSGDMRTTNSKPCGGGGDFAIQQNFAGSTWGKQYLTAPTSQSGSSTAYEKNLFRIAIKDVAQNVYINGTQVYPTGTPPSCVENFSVGTPIAGGTTPSYLEFQSVCANYITSDRPMMIAQFLSGACSGVGDPDMVYLSPLQQGVTQTSFYRNTVQSINANVLTLIGSTVDTPKIFDGGVQTTWTSSYVHPNYPVFPGGPKRVYIKHWPTPAAKQVNVYGDSTFTAITYGLGSVESYMYNAGTNIKSLYIEDVVCKQGDPSCLVNPDNFTCSKTPFQMSTGFLLIPDSVVWKASGIVGIHPNVDFVQRRDPLTGHYIPGPDPTLTVKPNGDTVYIFTLPNYYTIDQPGNYVLEVQWWNPDFEGCDKSRKDQKRINVKPSPFVDFVYSPNPICENNLVKFTPNTIDSATTLNVNLWQWSSNYGLNSTDTFPSFFYGNAGTDTVKLHFRIQNFCIGDTAHVLTINPLPVVAVTQDSTNFCAGSTATVTVQGPLAGATYTVFTSATGGTSIATGNGTTPFTFPNIVSDTSFYVECVSATGCVSITRKQVKFTVTSIPTATAAPSSIVACIGTSATFNVVSPISNGVYTWFDASTGGSQVNVGNAYTINPVVNSANYYLEVSVNGCISVVRFPVSLVAATTPSLSVVKDTLNKCSGQSATFDILNPDPTVTYNWYNTATGGTATNGTSYTINPAVTSGQYYVSATSANNCTSSPRLQVVLNVTQIPVVTVTAPDNVVVCKGATQSFSILNPISGVVYNWYSDAAGTTVVAANNTTFVTPPINGAAVYYVDGNANGCISVSKATVKVDTLVVLKPAINLTASSNFTNLIEFSWDAVANANGYEISINDSAFVPVNNIPSSLHHTVSGLNSNVVRCAKIKALGNNTCQNSISDSVCGKTVANVSYYPNTFSPNSSNAVNNTISICGVSIKELKYAVFNQWGQKIWETTSLNQDANGCYKLWDGTHNGVLQPAGVYMYASRLVFLDGRVEEKTGSINLIR